MFTWLIDCVSFGLPVLLHKSLAEPRTGGTVEGWQRLWPPTRGGRHCDWGPRRCLPAAAPVHAASSLTCFPSLSLPASSSLFLCQLSLSLWLHSHCCVPLCHLSLPLPPFSLILLFCTLSFVKKKTHSNIQSLPALWKLPLSPSFGSPEGCKKIKKKWKEDFKAKQKPRSTFLLYLGLLRASMPLSKFSLHINLSLLSRLSRRCRWGPVDKRKKEEGASHFLRHFFPPCFCSETQSFCSAALHACPIVPNSPTLIHTIFKQVTDWL